MRNIRKASDDNICKRVEKNMHNLLEEYLGKKMETSAFYRRITLAFD